MTAIPIRRALLSVWDKTGLPELARALHEAGAELVSTGNTATAIEAAGLPVTRVEDLTGFPECLDGRVKTLHPRVHAGLLADTLNPDHNQQLADLGIEPFQLLVSTLYPFEQTVASGADHDAIIEKIDIGGPAMVRAAAKNHGSLAVITDIAQYGEVLKAIADGGFTLEQRRRLAAQAYAHTAAYDAAVSSWFAASYAPDEVARRPAGRTSSPRCGPATTRCATARTRTRRRRCTCEVRVKPRTGGSEQPRSARTGLSRSRSAISPAAGHGVRGSSPGDNGWVRGSSPRTTTASPDAEVLHGKAMSYNNYVDADSARRAAFDFAEPCVAIIKHSNPCGIAIGTNIATAYAKALECDPLSAYGGVIAANSAVTDAMAEHILTSFAEVVIAPDFDPAAIEILTGKWKNIRLLRCAPPSWAAGEPGATRARSGSPDFEFRPVSGGMLAQTWDRIDAPGDDPAAWELKAGEAADAATLADLAFAWRAVPGGQVQRDPAGEGRRVGRRGHGAGEPGRLLPAGCGQSRKSGRRICGRVRRVFPVP